MYYLVKGGGSISLGCVVSLCDRGKGRGGVWKISFGCLWLLYMELMDQRVEVYMTRTLPFRNPPLGPP